MRRILALGCCAVYLAFGFVAGAAHVHQAADHHVEMRGVHLDHAHLGEVPDHRAAHHHERSPGDDDETQLGSRHVGHHDGDALYLNVTAQRSLDSGPRPSPALVAVGVAIAPPNRVSHCREQPTDPLRGPPDKAPTSSRGPPV